VARLDALVLPSARQILFAEGRASWNGICAAFPLLANELLDFFVARRTEVNPLWVLLARLAIALVTNFLAFVQAAVNLLAARLLT